MLSVSAITTDILPSQTQKKNEQAELLYLLKKKKMSKILECIVKKYALYYLQLKVEYNTIEIYLAKINIIKISQYW